MGGFLVSGERKGPQILETLIVVQGVECIQQFSENLVRISGGRSMNQIQNLGCNLLMKNSDSIVELSLSEILRIANWVSAWINHTSVVSGQKAGSFMDSLAIGEGEAEDDG